MPTAISILRLESTWMVVDKPDGLMVHSAPDGRDVLTLLRGRFPGEVLAAVHRLDAATSGCLLVARTRSALRFCTRAFAARQVRKTYLAVVRGHPDPADGEIFTHLSRATPGGVHMSVVEPGAGPAALTVYRTLEQQGANTLLAAEPITGRTHQLRVHFRHIGHPIAGDPLYAFPGDSPAARLYLHAFRLEFPDPSGNGERVLIEAPVSWGAL